VVLEASAAGVVLAATAVVGAVRGDHTITVDRVVTPEHLTSLPANVEPTSGSVPVTATIRDARPPSCSCAWPSPRSPGC
jgi:hypothetical protein